MCDQRKKRHADNAAAKSKATTLKRPAMLGKITKKKTTDQDHAHEATLDIYKMLGTNCRFKKPIHSLLKEL